MSQSIWWSLSWWSYNFCGVRGLCFLIRLKKDWISNLRLWRDLDWGVCKIRSSRPAESGGFSHCLYCLIVVSRRLILFWGSRRDEDEGGGWSLVMLRALCWCSWSWLDRFVVKIFGLVPNHMHPPYSSFVIVRFFIGIPSACLVSSLKDTLVSSDSWPIWPRFRFASRAWWEWIIVSNEYS